MQDGFMFYIIILKTLYGNILQTNPQKWLTAKGHKLLFLLSYWQIFASFHYMFNIRFWFVAQKKDIAIFGTIVSIYLPSFDKQWRLFLINNGWILQQRGTFSYLSSLQTPQFPKWHDSMQFFFNNGCHTNFSTQLFMQHCLVSFLF